MEKIRIVLKKIFFLPMWLTAIISVPSYIFVFYILITGNKKSGLSYLSYILSGYSLIISSTCFIRLIKVGKEQVCKVSLHDKLKRNPIVEKCLVDTNFYSKVSMCLGLFINLTYASVKLCTGIIYSSLWFISLAIYYVLLSLMRFLILNHLRKAPVGVNMKSEFKRYRMCGITLLVMNQALIIIMMYIVHEAKGFTYQGYLIYAMAAYAFYAIIIAFINLVKYRRGGSPILLAAKIINFTAALVSIMALETAMISQFGSDEHEFRKIMTASSGGIICLIIFAMAIYMIVHANKNLRGKCKDEEYE